MKWAGVLTGQHESTHLYGRVSVCLSNTHSCSSFYILPPSERLYSVSPGQVEIPATAFIIRTKKICFMKIVFSKWSSVDLYVYRRSSLHFHFPNQMRLYSKLFNGMVNKTFLATGMSRWRMESTKFSSMQKYECKRNNKFSPLNVHLNNKKTQFLPQWKHCITVTRIIWLM